MSSQYQRLSSLPASPTPANRADYNTSHSVTDATEIAVPLPLNKALATTTTHGGRGRSPAPSDAVHGSRRFDRRGAVAGSITRQQRVEAEGRHEVPVGRDTAHGVVTSEHEKPGENSRLAQIEGFRRGGGEDGRRRSSGAVEVRNLEGEAGAGEGV